MVRKIKKKRRSGNRSGSGGGNRRAAPRRATWLVPFDEEGVAGIYVHKHGDSNDHSACGPVVMCCQRAAAPYKALAPDLHGRVAEYKNQWGDSLTRWLDQGVQAMYFVLCDPDDPNAIYQFGLPAEHARPLLTGAVPHSAYRLADRRFVAEGLPPG